MKKILLCVLAYSINSFADLATWQDNTCLEDVQKSVKHISTVGEKIEIQTGNVFLNKYEYRSKLQNLFGLDNHFQGIIYNHDDDSYIVSGGNVHIKTGSLFISHKDKSKDNSYNMNHRINVRGPSGLWHAGGITRFADTLIVPIERFAPSAKSEIQFFDISNSTLPTKLDLSINLPSEKTGAVDAIFSAAENKVFVFAFDTKSFSIFQSSGSKISNSFNLLNKVKSKVFSGSNIKVIQQCNGDIYFVDLTNNGIVPPILNGKNVLHLYKFDFKNFSTECILKKNFSCEGHCNFRGAASISTEGNKMKLISSQMFRESKSDRLKINIFSE